MKKNHVSGEPAIKFYSDVVLLIFHIVHCQFDVISHTIRLYLIVRGNRWIPETNALKRFRQISLVTVFCGNQTLDSAGRKICFPCANFSARICTWLATPAPFHPQLAGFDVLVLYMEKQHKNRQKHSALSEIESNRDKEKQRSFMNAHTPDNSSRLIWLCSAYSHIIMATIHLFARCYICV